MSRSKQALLVLAVTFAAAAAFLYLPVPALEAARADAETAAAYEIRADEHFRKVLAGKNLDRPFPPMRMRDENPSTAEKVELGRLLYFDPLLSGEDDVSCAHCHHPDLGFSDNRGRSMGKGGRGLGPARTGGALLRRGSPTVWNAAFNHRQFWDGRAADLEEQAGKPIQDPAEMAQDPAELEAELRANAEYVQLFHGAFGNGNGAVPEETVTFENVTFAIAAFERSLVSRNSRFDRYARGERGALSESERRGLNLFRSLKTRCFECHNLPTFNNPDFKVLGVPPAEGLDAPDVGRGEFDGEASDGAFKVPTLRNVALTAPYMHNGAFATLSEVLDFYAGGGGPGQGLEVPNVDDKIRAFELDDGEKRDLVAFLHALTDESRKPAIPERVPSGLPVVEPLPNQSPELAAFTPAPEPEREAAVRRVGRRLVVEPGERIQDAIDAAEPGDVVAVMPGTYHETLTLDLSGITLAGQAGAGGKRPVLDGRGVLSDGIIGSGSDLEIRGFEIRDYTANGVMINLGSNLEFRDLHLANTGLYGLYPVEVVGVVIEDCSVTGARDAGLYVGQSKDIVVRRNVAFGNVTGIEIENSLHAVVEDNDVYDNAGGILVFGLPNNPSKISRDCKVVGNRVIENNHVNFGDPHAIVSRVPSGTGIMILAGDDVEVAGNEIRGNDSFGVAVVGLDSQFGKGSTYDLDPTPERCWIHGNVMVDNGHAPAPIVTDAGYGGADLLWDLSGYDNSWDQPGASRLPYALPGKDWSRLRRRANDRLWRLLAALGV